MDSKAYSGEHAPDAPLQPKHWTSRLSVREIAQIQHASAYAADYSHAGVPGHGQFLLIAKLADLLDEATRD